MTPAAETVLALLIAALLLCLSRLLFIRLVSPHQAGALPVFAVLPASGEGQGLEQAIRHLEWLRAEKLSQFTIVIVDGGLTPAGQDLVQALRRKIPGLLFCPAEEATWILKRKDDHGYFSL